MFPDKKQIKSEVSPTNIQNPFGSTSLQISTHRPPSKSNGGARARKTRKRQRKECKPKKTCERKTKNESGNSDERLKKLQSRGLPPKKGKARSGHTYAIGVWRTRQ